MIMNTNEGAPLSELNKYVQGPSSSTDSSVALFDGATGKLIKDSGFTIGKSIPSDAVFTDTTYESKSASSEGTDVSLVTTGEKYIWNNKGSYSKPSGGIPASDLASAVQTSLGKADTAYQLPSGGITESDLSTTVNTSLDLADSAYQKPSGGIPDTDLTSAVQTSLGKADSSLQSTDIYDDLDSTATNKALSANQGKVLDAKITAIDGKIPSTASSSNQLATTEYVQTAIGNAIASSY